MPLLAAGLLIAETCARPTDTLDTGDALAAILRRFCSADRTAFVDAAGLGLDVAFTLDNPFVQDVLDELAKRLSAWPRRRATDPRAGRATGGRGLEPYGTGRRCD